MTGKRHKVLMAFVAGWLLSLVLSPKSLMGVFGRRSSK